MIYRIDMQHFLTHAIDHFTREELTHFQYVVISAKVRNQHRTNNVVKLNNLYPDSEIVIAYNEYNDKNILEKMYMEMLCPEKGSTDNDWIANDMYNVFVNPLIQHTDIVIICDRLENDYIDVIVKYLKKKFEIEVIDLNVLFTKGRIGPIYIDRSEIWDKAVDVRKSSVREMIKSLESTKEGKLKLLGRMSRKDKIEKLEELGIKITEADKKNLDKIIIDAWIDVDDDE